MRSSALVVLFNAGQLMEPCMVSCSAISQWSWLQPQCISCVAGTDSHMLHKVHHARSMHLCLGVGWGGVGGGEVVTLNCAWFSGRSSGVWRSCAASHRLQGC